ncbi:unnamed protein product [Knipowitschia caucasica]|uniref:Ciliary microtubule inner protein 2B n=1 Tax=Knipowitschia caucasica TaxID=637954 RepID=A0AAV2IYJ1_KNICA
MNADYGLKFRQVLLTPDPHYIPGYAGYCPQLKYNMGKSYGPLTHELLSSPDVSHSARLMVGASEPWSEPRDLCTEPQVPKGIPGYTGFVPKSQSQFACTYGEMCRKALGEFHQERKRSQHQSVRLPALSRRPQDVSTPLTPVSMGRAVVPFKPSRPFLPIERPYVMDDLNPHKYFISGFTGHVPKTRFLFGKGYSITTNQALILFGKQQRHEPSGQEPAKGGSSPSHYPPKRPVVPAFTGHIPGYRFLYGQTFGQLSQKALEQSGSKRAA